MFQFLDKKHLCITQALACALATIWLIWLINFRLLSVQMPRSLAVSCWDIILLPRWKDRSFSFFSLPITMKEHFYRRWTTAKHVTSYTARQEILVNFYNHWQFSWQSRVDNKAELLLWLWQICDFGLAKWKAYSQTNTDSRSRRPETITHVPPEKWIDINQPRTVKYDVYSFAVLLWELLTEQQPFKHGIIHEILC